MVTNKIINWLERDVNINDKEIIIYGVEQMWLISINVLTFFLISVALHNILLGICFLMGFIPLRMLAVDSKGNVYPCPELLEQIGQIAYEKNQTLFNILDQREKILEIWGLGSKMIAPCSECEYKKTCSDCRAVDYKLGNIHFKTVCNRFKE